MTSVKFLEIAEKTDVPESVKTILGDEFLAQLNCQNPPPILFMDVAKERDWGGFCDKEDKTKMGEIVIDSFYLGRPRAVKSIYVHELCHRILSNRLGHGAQFFCLNHTLNLRVGMDKNCSLYDMQDLDDDLVPVALSLIFPMAEDLAKSDKTAEELADFICQSLADSKIAEKAGELESVKKALNFSQKQNASLFSDYKARQKIVIQNYFMLFLSGAASASIFLEFVK